MRFATRFFPIVSTLALGVALAVSTADAKPATSDIADAPKTGPAADYPVVLGSPFTIDGKTYTPSDSMNYDAVGYAEQDAPDAEISAAHRTLPLPSYIEVTALESGRTILVRVTRRGPMAGPYVLGLSAGAWHQLGLVEGKKTAVRVRRVNPPEAERALLRLGKNAPERIETPPGLLAVLRRRLGDSGDALLSGPTQPAPKPGMPSATVSSGPADVSAAVDMAPPSKQSAKTQGGVPSPKPAVKPAGAAPMPKPSTPAINPSPASKSSPGAAVKAPSAPTPAAKEQKAERSAPSAPSSGAWEVQVATMSTRDRAETVAKAVGGHVLPAGKFWRVRVGPLKDRAEADTALAKARAAGYGDARVLHSD